MIRQQFERFRPRILIRPKIKTTGEGLHSESWAAGISPTLSLCSKSVKVNCGKQEDRSQIAPSYTESVTTSECRPGSSAVTTAAPASLSQGNDEAKNLCSECGSIFSSRKNVLAHIRFVHLAEYPVRCPICQLGCRGPGDLRVHLETHSTVKKYRYPVCTMKFKQKVARNRHIKSVHSEHSSMLHASLRRVRAPQVRH